MNERLRRLILGDRQTIAGTVYGTIIVMSVLAAGAHAYEHHLWRLVVLAGGSAVVLWLAHVYSHGLGESLGLGRRVTFEELVSIARREYSVIAAAILPLAAVALGAVGLLAHEQQFGSRSGSGWQCSPLRRFDTRASSAWVRPRLSSPSASTSQSA